MAILLALAFALHGGHGLAIHLSGRQEPLMAKTSELTGEAKLKRQCITGHAPGAVCSPDENGFTEVAQMGDDKQMEIFIRRLIDYRGGEVEGVGKISGIAGFYSGTHDRKNFTQLLKELHQKDYIDDISPDGHDSKGATAHFRLSETGYKEVAKLNDPIAMELFVRREIASVCAHAIHEKGLAKVAYNHTGKNQSSFSKLALDLERVVFVENYKFPLSVFDMSDDGYTFFKGLNRTGQMGRFARLLIRLRGGIVSNDSAFAALLPKLGGFKTFYALSKAVEKESFVSWNAGAPWPLPPVMSSVQDSQPWNKFKLRVPDFELASVDDVAPSDDPDVKSF